MSKKGWIKLHRRIQDHWIYQEKRQFSRYEAWIDLIMMANHKDNRVLIDNELINVEKGQLITSIRKLCDKWNWSNTKVSNFLNLLQEDEMISYKSDTKKTVINICNYSSYHDSSNKENDTEASHERHESISEAYQKHTNKNVKNYKNVKNDKEKDYTSKIKNLLTVYSSQIENFNKLNKEYWDVIRETRKTGRISKSVIYNTMKKWERYDPVVIKYALQSHIDLHAGKREEYTIGIMRNTNKEEAEDRMNRKPIKKGFNQPKSIEIIPDWFKNRNQQEQQEQNDNEDDKIVEMQEIIDKYRSNGG